jgi:hypothetical protein
MVKEGTAPVPKDIKKRILFYYCKSMDIYMAQGTFTAMLDQLDRHKASAQNQQIIASSSSGNNQRTDAKSIAAGN